MKTYILIAYIVLINLLAAFICVLDKRKAIKQKRRISEATLWLISFAGGSAGMYFAMLAVRHKTLHKSFMVVLPVLIIFQMTFVLLLTKLIEQHII